MRQDEAEDARRSEVKGGQRGRGVIEGGGDGGEEEGGLRGRVYTGRGRF